MDNERSSRINKFEKRRKNTKLITLFLIFGVVLIIFLIGIWLFGGNDPVDESQNGLAQNEDGNYFLNTGEDENEQDESDGSLERESNTSEEQDEIEEKDEEAEESSQSESEDYEIENIITEDGNVISAYRADWPAIGTNQTGPHTTNYNNGSEDRIEIKRAVSAVTEIPEPDMIEVWIGNGGEGKVVATVTNTNYTENFRVYLDWTDGEGWKPTSVEVLRELDK